MKGQRLIFRNHGKPLEQLELESFDLPHLKTEEVLFSIIAAPVNPADINYIEGTYGIKPQLPTVAGIECVGTVLESRSPLFSKGDLVMPLQKVGGWSTHAITQSNNLLKLPPEIDPLQASMLKVNPATAWLLLHHFEELNKGDFVVLNAANSGVGQCVIQLAVNLGIKTICFLRNESLKPQLLKLGATFVASDTSQGFDLARSTFGKAPASLSFNAVGGESALRLLKLLSNSGTHITYGAMGRKPLTIPNGPLIFGDIRIRGLWVTKWIGNATLSELTSVYGKLAESVVAGSLTQKIDSTYRLEEFVEALERSNNKGRDGKILFTNQ